MSLLEIVFAIAALAFFFFALIAMYPTILLSMHESEHRVAGNLVAQELLDNCSSTSFANLGSGAFTPSAPGSLTFLAKVTLSDQTVLTPEVSISSGPSPSTSNNLRLVTVKVIWSERNKVLQVIRHRRIAKLLR